MNDCKDALTFDTEFLKTDYLAMSSVFSLITRDNYDEAKQKWGASVPGYFTGDFDSFSIKRSQLTEMFSESSLVATSGQHFRRALSPDAAKNYAACLAKDSSDPIVAWVESSDETSIQIKTLNRMTDTTVHCSIVGGTQPTNKPSNLVTGAEEVLDFGWIPRNGVTVSINVKNVATDNTIKGVVVRVPPVIKFERRTETRAKSVVIRAGAGGQGSTAGSPLYGSGALVADLGFSIKSETLEQSPASGVGGLVPTIQWTPILSANRIVRLEGQVTHAEADQGKDQRIVDYTYTVQTTRDYLVETGTVSVVVSQKDALFL